MRTIFILMLLLAGIVRASGTSDDLLSSLREGSENTQPSAHGVWVHPAWDSYQKFFAGRVQEVSEKTMDFSRWTNLVLDGQFAQAAHLWTAIENQIPAALVNDAKATQIYLLWKLGLSQTYFNQWLKFLANPQYASSPAEDALEVVTTKNLDAWLLQTAVMVDDKRQFVLDHVNENKPFVWTLRAWTQLRDQAQASVLLTKLKPENLLIPYLVDTAVFEDMKAGKIVEAAKLLQKYQEPNLEAQQDLDLLAKNDLTAARILFQAGQLKPSTEFYRKIPNQSSMFLIAQEELTWVYLRLNDSEHLRGQLQGLSSPLFTDRFLPEVYLLRAISDLKMCYYESVEKDLSDFKRVNAGWAAKIDQALAASVAPAPSDPDAYTKRAITAVEHLQSEKQALELLGQQSIAAALPAVGSQKHWKDYLADLQTDLEQQKKIKNQEFTRQWRNQRAALQEAIRKILFVKVEYANQVRNLASEGSVMDQKNLEASNSKASSASRTGSPMAKKDEIVFPADTEVWSDELFKLRSTAQALCMKKKGAH